MATQLSARCSSLWDWGFSSPYPMYVYRYVCTYACVVSYRIQETLSLSAWCYFWEVSAELSRQRGERGESGSRRLWKITLTILGEWAVIRTADFTELQWVMSSRASVSLSCRTGKFMRSWGVSPYAHPALPQRCARPAPEVIQLWHRSSAAAHKPGHVHYLQLASVRAAHMTILQHVLNPSSLSSMQFIWRP